MPSSASQSQSQFAKLVGIIHYVKIIRNTHFNVMIWKCQLINVIIDKTTALFWILLIQYTNIESRAFVSSFVLHIEAVQSEFSKRCYALSNRF